MIGALQWRPTDTLDIALDGQYSKRESTEDRNVLQITEGLRGVKPLLIGDGSNGYSEGALIKYSGNSNLENQLELRERDEEYKGGGATVTWKPGKLVLTGDASFSQSHRTETQRATRMRSTRRVGYTLDYTDSPDVPVVTFDGFDITNPANFNAPAANAVYARNRFVTDREDDIWAGRLDGEYNFDGGFLRSIKAGARYSEHHRTLDGNANSDLNTILGYGGLTPAQIINTANVNCRRAFPTKEYFPSAGTNVTQWATFDNACLFRTFTGSDSALPFPTETRDPGDINVRERIKAAYAMASFGGDLGATPFSGNVGLRYVKTNITSIGYRLPFRVTIDTTADNYTVAADPTGTISTDTLRGEYQYWLPSLNVGFDLSDKVKLRLAGYRALARSPIESFGAGINLNPGTGPGGSPSEVVFNPTSGNPNLKPMRAWNADVSLELYLTPETLFSVAGYYKWLRGAVISRNQTIPTTINVSTVIDGGAPSSQSYDVNLIVPANDPEMRHLYGVEFTGSHAFNYLPGPLGGFGVNGSLNIAFANFEYPDTSALATYLDPANLIGLSKYVANGTVYWEGGGFSLRAANPVQFRAFDPEKVDSYELGWKGSLFDRRLRFASASFTTARRNSPPGSRQSYRSRC